MKSSRYKPQNSCEVFYQLLMDSKIPIDQDINTKEINSKIKLINSKMNELSQYQQQQWQQILMSKIRQLYRQASQSKFRDRNSKYLRQSMRILVVVCSSKGIQYNFNELAKMIKSTYLAQPNEPVKALLVKAGIQIKQSEVLQYTPQLTLNKVFCCFCCQIE